MAFITSFSVLGCYAVHVSLKEIWEFGDFVPDTEILEIIAVNLEIVVISFDKLSCCITFSISKLALVETTGHFEPPKLVRMIPAFKPAKQAKRTKIRQLIIFERVNFQCSLRVLTYLVIY